MAGLIKGQILKHLSKFVKNLNPSQINLSAIKGEGELNNLELNEVVLTELLELPAWIRLTKASCNRAAIRIQWTKLKTVPIQLQLDEIRVSLETCEELRTGESTNKINLSQSTNGAYGFTDKVVDGITVSINLVYVTLNSLAFTASFQMSRILLESKNPAWQKAGLTLTRLKDVDKGEVLIFKEISWQTVRIEAKSTVNKELTPLRLITNQARCRITIKKRMSDCAILGCRLVLILDDLLWVLTDDQLKAALHFMDSISGLVKKATTTTQKAKAERKLENHDVKLNLPKSRSSSANSASAKTFQKYDVVETSYHFYSDRIDLHFCDDPGGGRSSHPELAQGGAFQVSLSKLQIDYYPYHLARGDRKYWVRYTDSPHKGWLHSNLASFDTRLLDVLLSGRNHTPLSRVRKTPLGASGTSLSRGEPEDDAMRDTVVKQLSRLMTENVVVRLHDVSVWCVATSTSPSASGSKLQELVKGDHGRLHLPEDLPLLHLEFTSFYYPGDLDFPLPPPVLMVHLNPLTIWLDVLTIIWINAFMLNLQKSVQSLQASLDLEQSDSFYADVKLEILMPRIICGSRMQHKIEPQLKPSSLQIQASKISIANYRSLETGSRADLATVLELFQQSPLFFGAEFPSKPQDVSVVCQKFVSHATGTDCVKKPPSLNSSMNMFTKDFLWTDARDMWYILVDSLWAEFAVPRCLNRPVPLVDAIPLAAWIYAKPQERAIVAPATAGRPNRKLLMNYYSEEGTENNSEPGDCSTGSSEKGIHVLAHTSKLVSVQLDHHQLIFLLRLAESLSELSAFLSADTTNIDPAESIVAVGAVLPQLDLSLLLQPPLLDPSSNVSTPGTLDPSSLPPTPGLFNNMTSSESLSLHCVEAKVKSRTEVETAEARVVSTGEFACVDTGLRVRSETKPVIDHSDPLSAFSISSQEYSQVSSNLFHSSQMTMSSACSTPSHSSASQPGPLPALRLSLAPDTGEYGGDTGTFRPESSAGYQYQVPPRSKGITSSFNSLMDSMGLTPSSKESSSGYRSPDCDLDTLSVRSDESGESTWDTEGFVIMGGEEDLCEGLFTVQRDDRNISPAELAEEVYEASQYLPEIRLQTPIPETKEEVEDLQTSVLTLHLGRIQFSQISGSTRPTTAQTSTEGEVSSILVSVGSLAIDPLYVQSWKQFQQRFCQSGKGWSESTLCPLDSSSIKLRLESKAPVNPHLALKDLPEEFSLTVAEKIARISDGCVELEAHGLSLKFLSSTLNRLAEFGLDEVLPTPLPLLLNLKDIRVLLEDDTPPPPGVPAPPPVHLEVSALTVVRDKAGLVRLTGLSADRTVVPARENTRSETERQLELARTEIQLLRQQMAEQQLKDSRSSQQTKVVQGELDQAKRQVSDMLLERDSLLQTLNYLQEELFRAGKK